MAAQLRELGEKIARAPVATLQGVLKPLHFDAELAQYGTRFVIGTRQWVFDDVEAWRCGESGRCRVLLAGPGEGKTAIVARLVAMQRDQVLAVHLCRHDDAEQSKPCALLRSLAAMLCTRLPGFAAALGDVPAAMRESTDPKEVFDALLATPLSGLAPPADAKPRLIIIDALDEIPKADQPRLLNVIANELSKLPSWLRIFTTSREEPQIRRALIAFEPRELRADCLLYTSDAGDE